MNTYENGVAVGVSDCNSRPQRNKNVAVPGHYHAIATGLQNISKTLRHIERHDLFCDPLAGNPAAVVTAMPRIDHDGALFQTCGRSRAAGELQHTTSATSKLAADQRSRQKFLGITNPL